MKRCCRSKRKNKKNDKESKNRKVDEKKISEQEPHSKDSLDTSHEQFLLEIEEYSKKLREDAEKCEEEDTTVSCGEEQELEIDNLHQVIEDLKKEPQLLKQLNIYG